MKKIILNSSNYYICEYSEACESWLTDEFKIKEVEELPPYTSKESRFCILQEDGTWFFDEGTYNIKVTQRRKQAVERIRQQMIERSKRLLEEYLAENPVTSSCHGGVTKRYTITSDKQQYLASMILSAQMAAQTGSEYQPSWNAAGEPCSYDWTLEELIQLAMEIEAVVRPLVSRQQEIEVELNKAATIEQLEEVDISFNKGGGEDEKTE